MIPNHCSSSHQGSCLHPSSPGTCRGAVQPEQTVSLDVAPCAAAAARSHNASTTHQFRPDQHHKLTHRPRGRSRRACRLPAVAQRTSCWHRSGLVLGPREIRRLGSGHHWRHMQQCINSTAASSLQLAPDRPNQQHHHPNQRLTMVSSCASLSRRCSTQSRSEWRKVRAGSGMEARLAVSTSGSVAEVRQAMPD